jgi:hypothetical protein
MRSGDLPWRSPSLLAQFVVGLQIRLILPAFANWANYRFPQSN